MMTATERVRAWRQANPEAYKAANKRRWQAQKQLRAERKAYWVEQLGGCCAHCGGTKRLEFDHVDPSTKMHKGHSPSQMLAWSEERLAEEMAKCQLLCHPCHVAKTRQELAQGMTLRPY